MASIRQDKRTGRYLIVFRYGGRQFQRGLKTTARKDADAARARVDETIRLLERGRLEIPDDADPVTFILSDGTQKKKPAARKQLTLGELLQAYDCGRIEKVKEDGTVATERIHVKHLRKYLPLRNAAQSVAAPTSNATSPDGSRTSGEGNRSGSRRIPLQYPPSIGEFAPQLKLVDHDASPENSRAWRLAMFDRMRDGFCSSDVPSMYQTQIL